MNGISSNYQISFGALVPKLKYNGKPKLAQWQINQIKVLKKRIKLIDKALFQKEAQINVESPDGSYLKHLNKELGTLQKQRDDAAREIEEIKRGIPQYSTRFYDTERSIQKTILEPLEEKFNDDYGAMLHKQF